MAHAIISRIEAKAQGRPRYYPGTPCKNGHLEERSTASAMCLACLREWASVYRVAEREKVNAVVRLANAKRRAAEPETVREGARRRMAEWRDANPEKEFQRSRAYGEANREKIAERARAYRAANPEKSRASANKWRAANPETYAQISAQGSRTRRARKRAAEGSHTVDDIQRIFEAQNGKCALCRAKVGKKFHVDHIKPLSKGGSNAARNLQILCSACNIRKGASDPLVHARSLGLLL